MAASLWPQHLDGHSIVELYVTRGDDYSHPADTDDGLDPILARDDVAAVHARDDSEACFGARDDDFAIHALTAPRDSTGSVFYLRRRRKRRQACRGCRRPPHAERARSRCSKASTDSLAKRATTSAFSSIGGSKNSMAALAPS